MTNQRRRCDQMSRWDFEFIRGGPPGLRWRGRHTDPSIVDRAHLQLADAASAGPFQPYHAAAELNLSEAEGFINRCSDDVSSQARDRLRDVLGQIRERADSVRGCAILFASGRPMGTLGEILSSHAMIHAAEGEFFRRALVRAAENFGLPVTRIAERDLWAVAERCIGFPSRKMQQHLAVMGRAVGSPWRQDQKYASLAAWILLANPNVSVGEVNAMTYRQRARSSPRTRPEHR